MPTAQQIFTQCWIDLGIGYPGEVPGASESFNGLNKLNMMLDNWSGARDLAYEIAVSRFPLSAASSFPIGPTAAAPFNVPRPIKIETATIVIVTGSAAELRYPMRMVTEDKWQSIVDRGSTGTVPDTLWVDPSVPNAVLNVTPQPLAADPTFLEIGIWVVVGQFASLATNANLPPAYYRAIVLGLQIELLPTYGSLISPAIAELRISQFKEAIAVVRNLNSLIQLVPLGPTAPPQKIPAALQNQGGQ